MQSFMNSIKKNIELWKRLNMQHLSWSYYIIKANLVCRNGFELLMSIRINLNFNYRFLKFDVALFKRKNMNMDMPDVPTQESIKQGNNFFL